MIPGTYTAPPRVTYAGELGGDRAMEFEQYLKERFAAVRMIGLDGIREVRAADCDVLVIDGVPLSGEGSVKSFPTSGLTPDDITVPTVLVGGVGGLVADELGLKLGWETGCLCLGDRMIPWDLDHPIFAGPFPVRVEPEMMASPENFREYAALQEVPEQVPTILVSTGTEGTRPGLISTGTGFGDSPDTEAIAGGIHGKGQDSIVVGRHGRFVQWGFSASAAELTPFGAAALANLICYAATLVGAPIHTFRRTPHRDGLASYLFLLDYFPREKHRAVLEDVLGADVPADVEGELADRMAWFHRNRAFIRYTGSGWCGHWEVDDDAREIGLANDDAALLAWCMDRLARPEGPDARAVTLYARYTNRCLTDAGEPEWFAENRNRLFFTDTGGFVFSSPDEPAPSVVRPSRGRWKNDTVSLRLGAEVDDDGVVASVEIRVTDAGYRVYGPRSTTGEALALLAAPGSPLVARGTTSVTADRLASESEVDTEMLSGTFRASLPLTGRAESVQVEVYLQACSPVLCLNPVRVRLECDWPR